jgi:hypothetical protein
MFRKNHSRNSRNPGLKTLSKKQEVTTLCFPAEVWHAANVAP